MAVCVLQRRRAARPVWVAAETATIRANYESLKEVTSSIGLLARTVAKDVAFWPTADMAARDSDVRFRR